MCIDAFCFYGQLNARDRNRNSDPERVPWQTYSGSWKPAGSTSRLTKPRPLELVVAFIMTL